MVKKCMTYSPKNPVQHLASSLSPAQGLKNPEKSIDYRSNVSRTPINPAPTNSPVQDLSASSSPVQGLTRTGKSINRPNGSRNPSASPRKTFNSKWRRRANSAIQQALQSSSYFNALPDYLTNWNY